MGEIKFNQFLHLVKILKAPFLKLISSVSFTAGISMCNLRNWLLQVSALDEMYTNSADSEPARIQLIMFRMKPDSFRVL